MVIGGGTKALEFPYGVVLDAQGQIHHFIYSNLTTELLGAKQLMRASLPKQPFTPECERRQTGKMKTWREEIHKKRGLTPAGGAEACERKRTKSAVTSLPSLPAEGLLLPEASGKKPEEGRRSCRGGGPAAEKSTHASLQPATRQSIFDNGLSCVVFFFIICILLEQVLRAST